MYVRLKFVMVGVPLAAVIVTSLLFAVLSVRFAYSSLEKSVTAKLAGAATARRDAIEQRREFWHRRAEMIANDAEVESWVRRMTRSSDQELAQEPPPQNLVKAALASQQEVVAAIAVDRRGQPLFARAQHGVDIAPWMDAINFQRIRETTDIGAHATAFGAAAGVAAPIGQRRIVGFIVVLFSLDGVFSLTRDYAGLGETGETMVVRVKGDESLKYVSPTRFRGRAARLPPNGLPDDPALGPAEATSVATMAAPAPSIATILDIVTTGETDILVDYRGKSTFAAARHVEGVDWIVIAKMDKDEIYGRLTSLLKWFGIAGLSLVVAIASIAFAFSSLALRQTAELKSAARRLGGGDYGARAPSGTVTELNDLSDAFNNMRDGILAALDRERQARKAANAASEAKSRFLATMSHEIRTPMNGVIGAADLLSRTPQTDNQRLLTEIIVGSGRSLVNLINDILDFSRIESRGVELENHPFEPRDLIENVATVAARLADKKQLPIVVDLDESVQGALVGDEGRLRQIFINLVGNAVKFTPDGHVLITASYGDDGVLSVSIADTGPGIPADRITAIFEAFEQADNSVTRQFEGTGLGLAISSRLAQAMNGDIDVTSAPGEGACFTFRAPLPRSPGKAERSSARLDGFVVALDEPLAPAAASLEKTLSRAGAVVIRGAPPDHADVAIVASFDAAESLMSRNIAAGIIMHGPIDDRAIAADRDDARFTMLPRPAPSHELLEAVAKSGSAARRRAAERATQGRDRALQDLLVLIVKDGSARDAVLETALSTAGASLKVCEDVETALGAFRNLRPDLVILDAPAPGAPGVEALRAIRALPDGGHSAPVIVLSADTSPKIRQETAAADRFVQKPFMEDRLIEEILSVTRQAAARAGVA